MTKSPSGLSELINTMAALRGPGGCPWDAEQTHESLVPYLLEETFELIEALESGSRADMREELGDVLYQVLFHADIASSVAEDSFTIEDVASDVEAKMRERHPHVFAEGGATTVDDVKRQWREIKAEQKKHRASPFEGIPGKLSALARAHSVMRRADQPMVVPGSARAPSFSTERELGALLLQIVAAAEDQDLDAERALRVAVRDIEQSASGNSRDLPGETAGA
jgi:XTP/dITP diphosphohydrolase